MQVRIVFLEKVGDYEQEQIAIVDAYQAETFVKHGKACYYSEFRSEMLESRKGAQTRVVEPENMSSEPTATPSKGRKRQAVSE